MLLQQLLWRTDGAGRLCVDEQGYRLTVVSLHPRLGAIFSVGRTIDLPLVRVSGRRQSVLNAMRAAEAAAFAILEIRAAPSLGSIAGPNRDFGTAECSAADA